MGDGKGTEYDRNPKVSDGGVRLNEVGEGGKDRDYRLLPDIRTVNSRDNHHCNGNDEALYTSVSYVSRKGCVDPTSWPIEIAQVKSMCVVCLPCRKKHRETGY